MGHGDNIVFTDRLDDPALGGQVEGAVTLVLPPNAVPKRVASSSPPAPPPTITIRYFIFRNQSAPACPQPHAIVKKEDDGTNELDVRLKHFGLRRTHPSVVPQDRHVLRRGLSVVLTLGHLNTHKKVQRIHISSTLAAR